MKGETTKIYVIYKYSEHNSVKERLDFIRGNNDNIVFFNFYDLKLKNWKKKAKEKIRNCNFAIFFYDNSSIESIKAASNVKYELKLVKKFRKKLVTIFTSSKEEILNISNAIKNNDINRLISEQKMVIDNNTLDVARDIFGEDYSENNINYDYFKPLGIVDGKKKVLDFSEWSVEYSLNNELLIENEVALKKTYYDLLMKEYELMINTSENLIERRNQMSDKYRNVCITLISLVTATLALGNLLLTGFSMLLAGFVCAFVSRFWKSALIESARNNEGKYAVINEIEKKLPANMFDTEYKYNTFKGIKSYSEREQSFPNVFFGVGIALAVIALFVIGVAIWQLIANGSYNIYDLIKTKD